MKPPSTKYRKTGKDGQEATWGAFALSLVVHGGALLLVGGYVIFQGVVPKSPFIPVEGPGMDDPRLEEVMPEPVDNPEIPELPTVTQDQPTQQAEPSAGAATSSDILVASAVSPSSFTLPPAVGAPTTVPRLGTGGGGSGSASSATGGPPASTKIVRSLFGTNVENANTMVGTFYDVGRDRKGNKRSRDTALMMAGKLGEEIARERGNPRVFSEVYAAPMKLFASRFLFPRASTSGAYEAFGEKAGAETPSFWIHYTAKVVPPEDGRYRFSGYGDDYILVLVDGKTVLVADNLVYTNNPENARKKATKSRFDWESPVDLHPVKWNKFCRYTLGDWIDWKKDEAKRVDIFIGDSYGQFVAFVGVEQEGEKVESTADGVPILPPFRLDGQKVDRDEFKALLSEGVDFLERGGPVFKTP